MDHGTRVGLWLLDEMVDRAATLDPNGRAESALAEAFARGVELLAGDGPSDEVRRETVETWARFDALRYAALELGEAHERLDRAVDELASELIERYERVWPLLERESRLKVALGRRSGPTTRPERPAEILLGAGRPPFDPAAGLLAGLARREVQLAIAADALARAERLPAPPGWQLDWPASRPLALVAHGLAALELKRQKGAGEPNPATRRRSDPLALATLSSRVVELRENVKILRLRQTALLVENRALQARIAQLEREIAALELEAAERSLSLDARHEPRPGGWLRRLLGRS